MIIPFTLILGGVGYLFYKSKNQVYFVEGDNINTPIGAKDEEDLYKDLDDLFI